MNYKTHLTFLVSTLFLMLLSFNSFAQNGGAEIRFLVHSLDCETSELCFDIQLRASEPGREFYLTEQNYRFGYNRISTVTPEISEELEVSELVLGEGSQGFSVYGPHTLIGTIDTVVSYNIELSGGDGIYVTPNEYINVGRLCMEVVDFDKLFFLDWNIEEFPGTYIGESYNGFRYGVEIVSHTNYYQDLSGMCTNTSPIAVDDFANIDPSGHVTICLPENDIANENTEINASSVELFNYPSGSEGAVTLEAETGCATFIAAENFTGMSTFEYQICDMGTSIPAWAGNDNPESTPDADTPRIFMNMPACDVAKVEIGVGTSVGVTIADAAIFNVNTFPNPASEVLNISYTLPEKADVSITLLNVLGQPVQQLDTETGASGKHNKSLNVSELSEGNYFVVLNIDGEIATKTVQIK